MQARAYEVLSDEKKRKLYDGGFDADSQQAPPGWEPGASGFGDFGGFQGFEQGFGSGANFGGGFGGEGFESIFEMMDDFIKGGRGKTGRRDVQRGRDIELGTRGC